MFATVAKKSRRSITWWFGPGSMEDIELRLWTAKVENDDRLIKGKVLGSYRVYCGNGGEHFADIDADISAWEGETGKWTTDILRARDGDMDAAWELASTTVDMELEDWTDPCDAIEVLLHGDPETGASSLEDIGFPVVVVDALTEIWEDIKKKATV